MHSSRMRTGRALTLSGGRDVCVCASQKDFFGGKEIEKKNFIKRFGGTPPENFRHPPSPS